MADKHVRLVIEFDIDEESLQEKSLSVDEVYRNVILRDSDTIDGFELTTNIPGFNVVSDFFLCDGKIVSQEFIRDRSRGDGLDQWREMIRAELEINGTSCYELAESEVEILQSATDVIDNLAVHMDSYMTNADLTEYDALDAVFAEDFPTIISNFRRQNDVRCLDSKIQLASIRAGESNSSGAKTKEQEPEL